jgi:hypothetical protein
MTAPDRIQITHRPRTRTMTMPDIRAAAAAPAPGENPATPPAPGPGKGPSEKDLYDLAEMFNGDPVPSMRRALEVWGNPPASETAAEALAARPLLERVAQLGDVIGRQTVAQVQQLAEQADAWLRENPPGQPVAIEPRGCPTPGACSCVEPTPSAPEPSPTFQDAIKLAQGCHDYSGGHSGAEGEAWHGAIGTVVDVLKRAAIGPWDNQLKAVYGVGVEAQAGEVEA